MAFRNSVRRASIVSFMVIDDRGESLLSSLDGFQELVLPEGEDVAERPDGDRVDLTIEVLHFADGVDVAVVHGKAAVKEHARHPGAEGSEQGRHVIGGSVHLQGELAGDALADDLLDLVEMCLLLRTGDGGREGGSEKDDKGG